jgi:hypothetical protein
LAVLSATVLLGWGILLSSHVSEPHWYGSLDQDWVSTAALIALPWLVGLALTHRARRASAYRRLTEQMMKTKGEYERLVAHAQRMEISNELDELLAIPSPPSHCRQRAPGGWRAARAPQPAWRRRLPRSSRQAASSPSTADTWP